MVCFGWNRLSVSGVLRVYRKEYSMTRLITLLCLVFLLTGCTMIARPVELGTNNPTDDCPVTQQPDLRFIPPRPNREYPAIDEFWFGTNALWTALPENGVWSNLPKNPDGYVQKVFWWREGYSWTEEPEPNLSVTGRRLDATAPPLLVSRPTNAFAEDIQSAMLVGVGFPTVGCWEITGVYADAELTFVVRVE